MNSDILNGMFEWVGAGFVMADILGLIRSWGKVQGVFWPGRIFFTAWGGWNVLYYPMLHQPFSTWGAFMLFLMNVLWVFLYLLLSQQSREYIDDRSTITFGDLNERP